MDKRVFKMVTRSLCLYEDQARAIDRIAEMESDGNPPSFSRVVRKAIAAYIATHGTKEE